MKSRRKNPKPCKGYKDKAGFGCEKPITIHDSGLCDECLNKWKIEQIKQGNTEVLTSITRKAKIEVKKENKEKREKVKKQKEAVKTLSNYKSELQTIINAIVRLLDNDKGCISCKHGWDGNWTRQRHAGHRLSVGSCPELRFNLLNIWGQCSICNNWKSGNEREYDKGLALNYGDLTLATVKDLRVKYPSLHITIPEIKEAIVKARGIKKDILNGKIYFRDEINEILGIYD